MWKQPLENLKWYSLLRQTIESGWGGGVELYGMLVYTYLFNCIGSLSFILFAFISCSLNITVYLETLKNVLLCLVSNFLLIVRAQRLQRKRSSFWYLFNIWSTKPTKGYDHLLLSVLIYLYQFPNSNWFLCCF